MDFTFVEAHSPRAYCIEGEGYLRFVCHGHMWVGTPSSSYCVEFDSDNEVRSHTDVCLI